MKLLSDEQKSAVIPKSEFTSLRPNERIVALTEDGYLFCDPKDGIVKFREDKSHAAELEGDKFQEPLPKMQQQTAFSR